MAKSILIIASHPDDEVLGCGATVAKLIKQGYQASTLILGEGLTSRKSLEDEVNWTDRIQTLRNQALKANEILGITDVRFYQLPDNRFDSIPLLSIIKIIENEINILKPDIVFTHGNYDLNIDHVITNRAVLTATRPQVVDCVKELYCFEVLSSTDYAFGQYGVFRPDTFYDVTNTLELKLNALKEYSEEIREFPHPRSLAGVIASCRKWGSYVGVEYAEAFMTVRRIL